jgi:Leucine-rich repeat (LRR) protein
MPACPIPCLVFGPSTKATLTFPCEFGQLANLKALVWGGALSGNSGPLVFPIDEQCMDGLVSLEEIMLGNYDVNRLPASLFNLPNLQKVSVRQAPVAALPSVISPNIRILKLSDAGVTGALPSFRNSALLEELNLANNNLQLGDVTAFDGCPKLRKIDLSNNNLSSKLFTFEGSSSLLSIDLRYNRLHGRIPSQWAGLVSCETVKLAHNSIEAPLDSLVNQVKLRSIDLSHNKIKYIPASEDDLFFRGWAGSWIPPSASMVDVSYNLLIQPGDDQTRGFFVPMGIAADQLWGALQHLDLSHNQLFGWLQLDELFYNLDVSYNSISMASIYETRLNPRSASLGRKIYSVDWRNQNTATRFSKEELPFASIDEAVDSGIDFKTVGFVPRHNSAEQVEWPPGSKLFPFQCPLW